MQEFIEKLIGRLEEEAEYQYKESDKAEEDIFEEISVSKARVKMGDCYNHAIEIVNQLAEEHNGGWIPCSERLPEYTDEYNVTVGVASEFGYYEKVTTLRFERIKGRVPIWVAPKEEVYRIIAWQPLPAPYQPKGE